MQQQNAAIYVWKEANCQLKTDTEGHRGLCKFPTANSPTSSPRIRRLPHHEFPTANSPTYLYRWRLSISEFAENPWRMFAQSFVLSANIIHREFVEFNSCEFVANIHHVSFK